MDKEKRKNITYLIISAIVSLSGLSLVLITKKFDIKFGIAILGGGILMVGMRGVTEFLNKIVPPFKNPFNKK